MTTIIKQNETFRRSIKLTYAQTGETQDLTGCTAYSQMRNVPGGDLIATAEVTIDAENGVITALWTADQTADFPIGTCGYDIWLKCGDDQKPIFTEQVSIVQGYTEISS